MKSIIKYLSTNILIVDWFLIPFFIISMFLLPYVGAGWDEQNAIYNGYRALRFAYFIFTGQFEQISLHEGSDEHGAALLFIPVLILKALGFRYSATSGGEVQYIFHVFNLTLFVASLRYFFLTLRSLSIRPFLALLGVIVVALHPRLFFGAYNSFYDVNFLSFTIIVSYYCLEFLRSPNRKSMFCAAFVTGINIDVRIVAVMFFAMTLIYGLVKFPKPQKVWLLPYTLITAVTVYLFWPMLWLNPLDNWAWAWGLNSNIGWNGEALYFGELIKARILPWHYNFVWIGLTTPLFVLALVLMGSIWGFIKMVSSPVKVCFYQPEIGWFIAWAWVPLLAPLVLNTTLFDGWRHHYFVFPPLVALGCILLNKVNLLEVKPVYRFMTFCLISGSTLIATYSTFPHCNIYFNPLYRITDKYKNDLGMSFEMDYWGVSYLQGLEAILRLTEKPIIRVRPDHMRPALLNWKLLSEADRSRVKLIEDGENYDYFVSNFRFRTQEFSPSIGNEVFSKSYLKTKFLTVREK